MGYFGLGASLFNVGQQKMNGDIHLDYSINDKTPSC